MKSTREIAKWAVDMAEKDDIDYNEKIQQLENMISWHLNDAFKIIKNINETSLNNADRSKRIIDLEAQYGIPKTHLI